MTKEQRDNLIDKLIENEIDVNGGDGDWYLKDLMRSGCPGYESMTDEELEKIAVSTSIDPLTCEYLEDEDGLMPESTE